MQEHFYLDIQTDDSEYYTSFSELDLNPCDLKIYNKDDENFPSSCSLFTDENQQKNVSDSVNPICLSDPISNSVGSSDILQIPLNTVWSDADFSICTDPHIDLSCSTYLILQNNAVEPITISTNRLQVISGEYSPIIGQIPTVTKKTVCRRFIVNLRKRKNRKQDCTLSTDHHAHINFSSLDLPPGTVTLLKKGPSFVPTQKFVDWGKPSKDFIKFKNKLRWRARYGDTGDDPAYDSEEDLFDCFKLPSRKDAPRSSDQALERFLELVENDLFHPDIPKTKFKPNLTIEEQDALRYLRSNKDISIRIQDKGSRFVILNSTDYVDKMDRYLKNNANFSKLDFDITETIMTKVDNWAKEWFLKGEINQTVVDFVCNVQAKPAKNYGLVKTHKPGQKLRVITAGTCSAVSNLSAFMERFLGPLSRSQKPLLVDTTDFLNLIEHLNTSFSLIPEHVILVTWDIEAMYPSIDNKLDFKLAGKYLTLERPSTDCLLDAIKITLDNNNSTFNNTHYLQTDGTAMGRKNA